MMGPIKKTCDDLMCVFPDIYITTIDVFIKYFVNIMAWSFKIWTSQNNEGKSKTVCRNSNHLVLRKYHKRRDLILKLTCETKLRVWSQ
jgi:hypothetical protein